VVSVSLYDAAAKGYRVRLLGCLTCEEPVQLPGGEQRFITLKIPAAGAETMGAGVELSRPVVSFNTVDEARIWEAGVKPHLRAEFVFKPAGTAWSYRRHRGVAFTPVASRVFNRCTGEVIVSDPPSEERARVPAGIEGCQKGGKEIGEAAPEREDGPLPRLGSTDINQAMQTAREEIAACDAQFKMRGNVVLDVVVAAAGGAPQSVRAEGTLDGTGVARCVVEAVRKVRFPRIQPATQTFKYPVSLRGE
jgi:hypothetical protein